MFRCSAPASPKTILTASFTLVPGAEFGENKLTYMEDTYLSQKEPCGNALGRYGAHRRQGLLLQPDSDGQVCHPAQRSLPKLGLENLNILPDPWRH